MGSSGFIAETKEKTFKNLSFSSVEDVYDVLWLLDAIIDGCGDFNVEALVTKIDFVNLANEINSDVLNEYILIQTGEKPLKAGDYGKTILEVVAERLNLSLKECEQELAKSIELLVSQNYRLWYRWYLQNYKNEMVCQNKTHPSPYNDLKGWKDIDYRRKYLWKKNIQPSDEFPDEFNELLEYRNKNLSEMRWYQSRTNLTEKQQEKLKFLKRNQVEIDKDISKVKRSLNLSINKNNQYGKKEIVSFDDSRDQYDSFDTYDSKTYDGLTYSKIVDIADKILTNKQRVIFYLYFENQLTQTEIANIINDNQGNVSRVLQKSIEKIRKEL